MNINKDGIQKKIDYLIEQQNQIKKELQQTKKQYNEIAQVEVQKYLGKCYKQDVEDEYDSKTVYYKVLDFYDEEDDYNQFWVLVVEDHIEDDINISSSYIHREHINLLGYNKFFLRQLTPISEKEFIEAIDNVYDHLIEFLQDFIIGANMENDDENAIRAYRALRAFCADTNQNIFNKEFKQITIEEMEKF